MGKKFCVMCGKEDVELIGSLCPDCYLKRNELITLPKRISGKYCKICGALWINGKWIRDSNSHPANAVEEIVYKELSNKMSIDENVEEFSFNIKSIWNDQGGHTFTTVEFKGKLRGISFSREAIVNLEIERSLCIYCFRKKTRYFEAIVQLRGKNSIGVDDKKRAFFESFFSKEVIDSISDVIEGREGVDYYFISKSVAKKLVSNVSSIVDVEINESYQNERVKNGKKEAKLVISLRI